MNNATTNQAGQNLNNKLSDARHAVVEMKLAHMRAAVAKMKSVVR